jgi:AraC family transcriptional regulator of adaptative response/methylated-DNA-[protein]-cysteine methyltransferase
MARKKGTSKAAAEDARWAALVSRNPEAEGTFFYAVRTTGVYCRPSCGARTPRRENVEFFPTAGAAEEAGYRPCRRCRPEQPPSGERHAAMVADLCRRIESSDRIPTLDALARHAGMSPSHLHRLFKAVTGVTPRAYGDAKRRQRIRAEMTRRSTVTEAILAAGYNSSGRFYEKSNRVLGMTPTRYRTGGSQTEIQFAVGQCSLGAILVAASTRGVCAILLGDDPERLVRDLQDSFPRAELVGGDAGFEELVARAVGLVETPGSGPGLPLDVRGTAFQQRVWRALQEIPPGETATYSEIAKRIGAPGSTRAVGRACAANVLAVVIPCHRVVRRDGALSGYRWGVERKRKLLAREEK